MKRRSWVLGGVVGAVAAGAGVGWSLWRDGRQAPDPAESAFWAMQFEQPGGGTA